MDGISVAWLGAAFLAGPGGAMLIVVGFYRVQRLDRQAAAAARQGMPMKDSPTIILGSPPPARVLNRMTTRVTRAVTALVGCNPQINMMSACPVCTQAPGPLHLVHATHAARKGQAGGMCQSG